MSKKIDLGFPPSPYQQKVFDFIQYGVGNAVIKACAGSGKTSTLISAINLIPDHKKCLFIAFNRSVVEELTKKLENCTNCTIKTIHGLGFQILSANLINPTTVNEYKYRLYLKDNINELTSIDLKEKLTQAQCNDYTGTITKLIDFSRYNLAQTVKEIQKTAKIYGIQTNYDECEVTLKCLQWGKTHLDTIDYTDMVWLPYELSLSPHGIKYDWLFIDEAQDLSKAAIKVFEMCFKRGTRFIAVGDDNQAIYMFAGASEEAFNTMCNKPKTKIFTLPITYRCPKKITALANTIVKDITPKPDAIDGFISHNVLIKDIKDNSLVLARSKSPLVYLYKKLLRRNVNCYIKGQDIGMELINTFYNINEEALNLSLKKQGVFSKLYELLFAKRNALMDFNGLDLEDATLSAVVINLYDNIRSLEILAEHLTTKKELIEHIKSIFKDESDGICLSTIHKAKGLEAENVYTLCPSSIPSKLAKLDWEKNQERNLQYVAYTRSKNTLNFVSEDEIPPYGVLISPSGIMGKLTDVERTICELNGTTPREQEKNANIVKFNLRTISDINNIEDYHNKNTITDTVDDDILKDLAEFLN